MGTAIDVASADIEKRLVELYATRRDEISAGLADYFTTYTGRYFEQLSARSDPLAITAVDVAALATLSVELRGRAVAALLIERNDEFNELLAKCPPPKTDMWDLAESAFDEGSALAKLYTALKTVTGISTVRASKLLACKRPQLVPVRDTEVTKVLGLGRWFWVPLHRALQNHELRDAISSTRPEIAGDVSVLRLLDVALWQQGKNS